mgnify:CR=1 FL=1
MGYDSPKSLGDRETGGGLSLPVWIPGSYLVREFSRHLSGLEARQGREHARRIATPRRRLARGEADLAALGDEAQRFHTRIERLPREGGAFLGFLVKWFFIIVSLIAATDILGWEQVTDAAVDALVARGGPLVAVLWGRDAQSLRPRLGAVPVVVEPPALGRLPPPLRHPLARAGTRPRARGGAWAAGRRCCLHAGARGRQ